jgi:hypothetical protein
MQVWGFRMCFVLIHIKAAVDSVTSNLASWKLLLMDIVYSNTEVMVYIMLYFSIMLHCIDLTLELLCRLCGTLFAILSLNSFIGHYMFRPNWPSSGVQVVMVKDSAAHYNAILFPPIVWYIPWTHCEYLCRKYTAPIRFQHKLWLRMNSLWISLQKVY